MNNDYQKQALVWDWDAYDNKPEYEYWCEYAGQFGKNVLLPMCAHGQAGAYMAEKGFDVVAFDITPEMIAEGKKRFGDISGLTLVVADMLKLDLCRKDFDFVFIAGHGDLHLLQSLEHVEKAFLSLQKHMRAGACLALELTLPAKESWSHPKKIFHPRVPNYSDKKVWKENEGEYNANEKRHYINQTVYIESASGIESFTQSICLQYYERDSIVELLDKCGFVIQNEYSNREREPWTAESDFWIVEAIKKF